MSIASEITRITDNVSDSYTAANAKGATMPATQDSDHLAATIATIPSGITPTGTMYIISNGTYNVEDKAIANVNVPTTAPASYRAFEKNSSGKLVSSTTTPWVPLPAGTTDVDKYLFCYAYYSTPANVVNGVIDLSSLTGTTGASAFAYAFQNCPGITGVNLSSLQTITAPEAFKLAFGSCTGITTVNMSSVTTINGSNVCAQMFSGCIGLTTVDLSSLTTITGGAATYEMFKGDGSITGIDLSSLTTINGNDATVGMFNGCYGMTGNLDLSSLTGIYGSRAAQYMFQSCTGLTGVDLGSLTSISSAQYMFMGCSGLTSVDLSSLKMLSSSSVCAYMFDGCTSLTNINLSSLFTIGSVASAYAMFRNNTSLTSVSLSSLVNIGSQNCCGSMFKGCTSLTSVDLSSVETVSGSTSCGEMFSDCTNLTSLAFPALAYMTSYTNQFNKMLLGVTGCTVHFPSNMQAVIGAWTDVTNGFDGTNTTVLFDLPATVILTGANTTQYQRNPKYDTATALAWRLKDTGAGISRVIDWTPFYTSGTSDPTVGTTIYSDAACTTAVTTISAIA